MRSLKKIAGGVSGDIFIIIALPLLLLCVNQEWIFTHPGLSDHWMYFGYFLNFPQHLQTFAGTYYGSRLPFIFPGVLAYQLFSPLVANYIFHLAFYYAAVISLYLVLKHTVGRRTALTATVLMGYYSYFLGAIGWNYADGVGITYFLLTMLTLTLAAKYSHWRVWLCLSGIFYGALIYTNLFLIIFTPSLIIYYLFANREHRKNSLHSSFILFSMGLGIITVLLGAANYTINRDFLFFIPSVRFTLTFTSQPNPYKADSLAWISNAPWLLLPTFTLLSSFLVLLSFPMYRLTIYSQFIRFFQLYFISNLLIMMFFELSGNFMLHDLAYSSYLIPFMFLAIGTQFTSILNCLKNHHFMLLIFGLTLILLIPLLFSYDFILFVHLNILLFTILLLSSIFITPLVFILFSKSNKKYFALLFVFVATNFVAVDWRVLKNIHKNEIFRDLNKNGLFPYVIYAPCNKVDCFIAIDKSVKAIQAFDPKANLRFWYDFKSPLGSVYQSIASAYLFWERRLVNDQFPSLQELQYEIPLNPDGAIAILSDEPDALQKANDSLSQVGLKAQLLSQQTIQAEDVAFTITFIKTQVKGLLASEPTALGKDFLNNWSKLNNDVDVVVDKTASSIQVVTNKSLFDWQLISPPIQVEPKAKYLLQLALQLKAEGAAVHVLGGDQRTILATRNWCKTQTADYSQKQFILDTANNDKVFIVIGNYSACPYPLPTASTFQFKDLEIRRIQPVEESSNASYHLGK